MPLNIIKIAVNKVLVEKMSRRSVAQDYNIPFKTLSRYCTKSENLKLFSSSRPKEKWVQCIKCKNWAHE